MERGPFCSPASYPARGPRRRSLLRPAAWRPPRRKRPRRRSKHPAPGRVPSQPLPATPALLSLIALRPPPPPHPTPTPPPPTHPSPCTPPPPPPPPPTPA